MRLFEVLLSMVAIVFLWYSIWSNKASGRIIGWGVPVLLIVTGVAHLIMEKARWQMGPIYIIALIVIVYFAAGIFSDFVKQKTVLQSILLSVPALMISVIGLLLPCLLPVFSFANPTGAYKIGTVDYTWTDNSRIAHDGFSRKINARIWYPAHPDSLLQKADYVPEVSLMAKALENHFGIPSFLLQYTKLIETHSYANASFVADVKTAPVIFLSHGNMNGGRFTNTFQAVDLASNGYIVVAVEHPGTALMATYPDGSYTPFHDSSSHLPMEYQIQNEASLPVIKEQVQDIGFALEQLKKLNQAESGSPLVGKADFSRLGIIGHSFGGATVVEAMYRYPVFRAGINMDGYLYGEERDEALDRPLLIMNGGFVPEELGESVEMQQTEQQRRARILGPKGGELDFAQAGHLSFTDIPLYSPLLHALSPKPQQNHASINEVTVAFMNRHLKGDTAASVQAIADRYPEVTMHPAYLGRF
ncbi:hypothetical protein AV540_17145 [Brevibacillus parabrevis]|uniref:alpha/beta hydrolase family protein n=1 Tax=Brevibacillus parabrevis TaxID=54914 RepID=UPI0007ABC089|nr:hypothetical protein [Brevibacillus parabrevis]KZE48325.1 hypothetical protein AV540_17145 [Brevibacillus parabrevis]